MNYMVYHIIDNIIKNSGRHLRKILIKECDYFIEDCPNYTRTVYESCPLIEYLPLVFPSNFIEFEKLFKNCQKLKVLSIYMVHMDEINEEKLLGYGEKLSKALIEFAPKNLRTIKFSEYDFKFSLKTLESLLEGWRGRTALSVITSDQIYEKEEYMEIINKYKNDGVIKDFKCVFYSDDYFFDY